MRSCINRWKKKKSQQQQKDYVENCWSWRTSAYTPTFITVADFLQMKMHFDCFNSIFFYVCFSYGCSYSFIHINKKKKKTSYDMILHHKTNHQQHCTSMLLIMIGCTRCYNEMVEWEIKSWKNTMCSQHNFPFTSTETPNKMSVWIAWTLLHEMNCGTVE